MTPREQVKKCLGANPSVEARPRLMAMLKDPAAKSITLRYDWIKDWDAVEGLGFRDGEEWIEFLLEEDGDGGEKKQDMTTLQQQVVDVVNGVDGAVVATGLVCRRLSGMPRATIYAALKRAVAAGEISKRGYGKYAGLKGDG